MAMTFQAHMYGSAGGSRTTLIQICFNLNPIGPDEIRVLPRYFIYIPINLYQITKKCFH